MYGYCYLHHSNITITFIYLLLPNQVIKITYRYIKSQII